MKRNYAGCSLGPKSGLRNESGRRLRIKARSVGSQLEAAYYLKKKKRNCVVTGRSACAEDVMGLFVLGCGSDIRVVGVGSGQISGSPVR